MPRAPTPFVSVIIPVFRGMETLGKCLDALGAQDYQPEGREIIVIDNGANDGIARLVGRHAGVTLLREERPGSYAARNKGISAARGELFAFTDADCVPAHDWLSKGVEHLRRLGWSGLVGGRIMLQPRDPSRPSLVERYEQVTAFDQKRFIESVGFAATANAFTSRAVVEDVGPFNASLKSLGDSEWGERVNAGGYPLVYAEDTCVAHPARRTFSELFARTARKAGGRYDKRVKKDPRVRARIKDVSRALFPVKRIQRLLRDTRHEDGVFRAKVLSVQALVSVMDAYETCRLTLGGTSRRA